MGSVADEFGHRPGPVKADGFAFVNEEGWQSVTKVPYVMDPQCTGVYVTSAAVYGQDLKLAAEPPPRPVKTYDLGPDVKRWAGDQEGAYECEVVKDIRVGPDANHDTVERLSR